MPLVEAPPGLVPVYFFEGKQARVADSFFRVVEHGPSLWISLFVGVRWSTVFAVRDPLPSGTSVSFPFLQ